MGYEEYDCLKHSVLTKVARKFATPKDYKGARFFVETPEMADNISIDIEYNPRHLAGYRHPDAPSGVNKLQRVENISVTLPCMKEKVKIPARIMKALRMPGTENTPWGAQKIARELEALDTLIQKRREWARWQILTGGAIAYNEIANGGIAFNVNFGIAGTHLITLTGLDLWSSYENSDPVGDVTDAKIVYVQDCEKEARVAVVNSITMKHMVKHPQIRSYMGDAWKTQVGQSGRIQRFMDLDWEVYDLGYVPEGGVYTKFLPDGKVVIQSDDPHPEYVGIFPDVKAASPGRFSKAWDEEDPSGTWAMVGVNPCPSAERIEEFMCLTVS